MFFFVLFCFLKLCNFELISDKMHCFLRSIRKGVLPLHQYYLLLSNIKLSIINIQYLQLCIFYLPLSKRVYYNHSPTISSLIGEK